MSLARKIFDNIQQTGWEPGAYPDSKIRSKRLPFVTLVAEPKDNTVFPVPDGAYGVLSVRANHNLSRYIRLIVD